MNVQPRSADEEFWSLSVEVQDRVRYAEVVLDPARWFAVVQDCRAALDLLWPTSSAIHMRYIEDAKALRAAGGDFTELHVPRRADVRAVCLMLAGYAAENLCKAVMIARISVAERDRVQQKASLPKLPLSHDLVGMLDDIGFPSSDSDRWQAWRLSRAARWYARYPMPIDAAELGRGVDGKPADYWMLHRSSDQVDVTDFLDRLQTFCSSAVVGAATGAPAP